MNDRRHLLVLVATVLVVLGFGLAVLRPRASHAGELRAQLEQAQSETRTLQDHLATLLEASLHRDEFEADAEFYESLLPRHTHLVRTIRLLHKASLEAGVDLREMAPSQPADHITMPGADTIAMTLVIEGSYDRIEAFVNRLEQLERATQLIAYTFTPAQEGGRTVLTAALTLEMFMYDPDAPATEPGTEAAPVEPPVTEEASS
jgi:Tfp pilus assembly protein PilO